MVTVPAGPQKVGDLDDSDDALEIELTPTASAASGAGEDVAPASTDTIPAATMPPAATDTIPAATMPPASTATIPVPVFTTP